MATVLCVAVHPNPIAREGLKAILANSSFAPVCATSSTEEVPTTIATAGEQVLVLIGVRQAADVPEAIRVAKASFPDGAIVVIGDACNRDLVMSALTLGAATFIDEGVATPTLIKELELVARGEPVISVSLIKPLLALRSGPASERSVGPSITIDPRELPECEDEDEAKPNAHLSAREAAILTALVQGTPNKMIAYQLSISEATVKVHVKAILRKIQVKNRTQAAIWALHHQGLGKSERAGNGDMRSPKWA